MTVIMLFFCLVLNIYAVYRNLKTTVRFLETEITGKYHTTTKCVYVFSVSVYINFDETLDPILHCLA